MASHTDSSKWSNILRRPEILLKETTIPKASSYHSITFNPSKESTAYCRVKYFDSILSNDYSKAALLERVKLPEETVFRAIENLRSYKNPLMWVRSDYFILFAKDEDFTDCFSTTDEEKARLDARLKKNKNEILYVPSSNIARSSNASISITTFGNDSRKTICVGRFYFSEAGCEVGDFGYSRLVDRGEEGVSDIGLFIGHVSDLKFQPSGRINYDDVSKYSNVDPEKSKMVYSFIESSTKNPLVRLNVSDRDHPTLASGMNVSFIKPDGNYVMILFSAYEATHSLFSLQTFHPELEYTHKELVSYAAAEGLDTSVIEMAWQWKQFYDTDKYYLLTGPYSRLSEEKINHELAHLDQYPTIENVYTKSAKLMLRSLINSFQSLRGNKEVNRSPVDGYVLVPLINVGFFKSLQKSFEESKKYYGGDQCQLLTQAYHANLLVYWLFMHIEEHHSIPVLNYKPGSILLEGDIPGFADDELQPTFVKIYEEQISDCTQAYGSEGSLADVLFYLANFVQFTQARGTDGLLIPYLY